MHLLSKGIEPEAALVAGVAPVARDRRDRRDVGRWDQEGRVVELAIVVAGEYHHEQVRVGEKRLLPDAELDHAAGVDRAGMDHQAGDAERAKIMQQQVQAIDTKPVSGNHADAGADCLYAPGIRERDHIAAIVKAVAPKPVNLLISAPGGLTMRDAAELGVRRVSVGGALARAAWGGFIRAAKELAEAGTFEGFAGATPHGELQEFRYRDGPEARLELPVGRRDVGEEDVAVRIWMERSDADLELPVRARGSCAP